MYVQLLAVVTFLVLSGSLSSCALCGSKEFWSTVSQLDEYSDGYISNVPDFELVKEAYEQLRSCNLYNKSKLVQTDARVAFLNDFLLKPMERFLHQEHLNEPEAEEAFVKRLAQFYHRFKPLYMRKDTAPEFFLRVRRVDSLIDSLAQLKDHKPLTVEMLMGAKQDYNTVRAKIQEIVDYEDVYSMEKDLTLAMKFLGSGPTRALEDVIFPQVHKDMVLTPKLVREMRSLFIANIEKRNYKVKSGKLVLVRKKKSN